MMTSRNVRLSALLIACGLLLKTASAGAQDFSLGFRDGLVTVVARDVSVSSILERWSHVGGTTIINGEKIHSAPVTLQLVDVPERDALAILLRGVGGYIVAGRNEAVGGPSSLSRILVLPTSTGAVTPLRNPPPASPAAAAAFERAGEQLQGAGFDNSQSAGAPLAPGFPAGAATAPSGAAFAPPPYPGAPAPPVVVGTARPGELTVVPPPLYRPSTAPIDRPGEAAPLVPVTRQSPGPQFPPQ